MNRYTFELSEKEAKSWNAFCKRQQKKAKTDFGGAGGRFGIAFYPTGIGIVVTVHDAQLNETENITDFDIW